MLPIDDILKRSSEDFFKEWMNTGSYFEGDRKFEFPGRRGKEHLLSKYGLQVREILLDMGFDEVYLKQFFPKENVEMQYGPEAPAILDRLYFLATMPRPDIGISDDRKNFIKEKIPGIDFDKLKQIFRDYKLDKIDPGDLSEELATRLKLKPEDATFLLDEAFPEVMNIEPKSSENVLNSHFTTAWFPTLAQLADKSTLPVMLFTSGWRYRREQREDAMHLRAHYNLSMVVMQENLTLADGMYITKEFFNKIGFKKLKFKKKPNQAVYYAYGTNYEIFVKDENFGWVEITEIGMYSPIALAKYGIKYPVFNSGPGLGRLVMLREGLKDLRELHHPEFYSFAFTDEEMAQSIKIVEAPLSDITDRLTQAIKESALEHRDDKSPCDILAFDGEVGESRIVARLVEVEENKNLLGPAAFNELYVHEGSIYGIPKDGLSQKLKNVVDNGVNTGISYTDSFLALVAKDVEKLLEGSFKGTKEYRLGMSKRLSDVNLQVPEEVRTFIQMKNNKIDVRGPVFFTIVLEFS